MYSEIWVAMLPDDEEIQGMCVCTQSHVEEIQGVCMYLEIWVGILGGLVGVVSAVPTQ